MKNDFKESNIDVVIPVYNGQQFIIDALDSVVYQTLLPRTIIVVDDGSTDDTASLVLAYAKNSTTEIKLVRKTNGGLSSARNAGIRKSTAEFIAFLDADDTWEKEKLEKQIVVFKNTELKNVALVYCDYDVIDSNGVFQYKNYKAPLDKKRMRGWVFKTLLERNKVTSSGSGVLIKRAVFDAIGFFDETLRWGEDWDMWLRIAEKYEFDFVNTVMVHIRKHEQNMTANPATVFERELYFYNKWITVLHGRYPVPLFWSNKITYRILSRFPRKDFFLILKNKLPKENYKILFRISLGSFFLYIPLFIIMQTFHTLFSPHYAWITIRLLRHKGK